MILTFSSVCRVGTQWQFIFCTFSDFFCFDSLLYVTLKHTKWVKRTKFARVAGSKLLIQNSIEIKTLIYFSSLEVANTLYGESEQSDGFLQTISKKICFYFDEIGLFETRAYYKLSKQTISSGQLKLRRITLTERTTQQQSLPTQITTTIEHNDFD